MDIKIAGIPVAELLAVYQRDKAVREEINKRTKKWQYDKYHNDEEWRERRKSQIYRYIKNRKEAEREGLPPRPRGRPRKVIIPEASDVPLPISMENLKLHDTGKDE